MAELRIVGASPLLLAKLDALQHESRFGDRSAFVLDILESYCVYRDNYYLHCLPDSVRILAEDVIKSQSKKSSDLLEYTLQTTVRIFRLRKTISRRISLLP
jgi:hypothetical protein